LFIWGLYINRRRAWRTDGGTAAFGAGALVLAVGGTAVNFLEVKVDGLEWLNHLLWAIILWQSWVGWWWWVGAGMGIGEVEVGPTPVCLHVFSLTAGYITGPDGEGTPTRTQGPGSQAQGRATARG